MEIRIRETGQVVFENEFRSLFPNISMPAVLTEEVLNSLNADAVLEGPQAVSSTPYQYSMRQGVEDINGKWFTKYVLGPVFQDIPAFEDRPAQSAAEQELAYKTLKDNEQAINVRNTRNQKLAESDWTQIVDVPVNKTAWATYRQVLRDVTEQAGFPWNVEWPTQPE